MISTDGRLAEERIKDAGDSAKTRVEALLSIKVCDAACGSAAFLIAANNYLGRRLAQIRTGEEYVTDDAVRRAKRDVLQHSIYGVDLNPMAVELAKVSLWINAAVRDMPLNFLDHRIQCGNSLIGVLDPAVLHVVDVELVRGKPCDILVVEVHDLARVCHERPRVRSQEHLLLPDAEGQRAATSGSKELTRPVGKDDCDGERPNKATHHLLQRVHRIAVVVLGQEVGNDFGVGLAPEEDAPAFQLLA